VIFEIGTPDFSKADLMATAPSFGAGTVRKAPLNYDIVSSMVQNDIRCRLIAHFSSWCPRSTQDICVPYFLLESCSDGEAPQEAGAVSACGNTSTAAHSWL
jgi:hypothetical protein